MLSKSTWRHLFRSLSQQSCILILGPRLATIATDEGEKPLEEAFAAQLADELQSKNVSFVAEQKSSLSYLSMRWVKGLQGKKAHHLREDLRDFCDSNLGKTPAVYRELADLPFFLVINTSPDEYMLQAFQRAGKEAELLHYNYQRNQSSLVPDMNAEKPIVYNLFGVLDKPESLVISKDDQADFINNLLKNTSTLPNEILQHFDKNKTYLFVGFDSNDWHLPLLFRSLRLQDEKEMSFYFHQEVVAQEVCDFYTDSFDFQFVAANFVDFAKELKTGYEQFLLENQRDINTNEEPAQTTYISKPQAGVNGKANILMMTANPKDSAALELNDEIDAVEEALAKGNDRGMFFFKPILNIKKERLLELILRYKPQIVHFSGHGTGTEGLMFYGSSGYSDMVRGDELAQLFRQFNDQITCVVLNACYSEEQAETIAKFIPNVIGTDNAVNDQLAIRFSEGFYISLFNGRSYEQAFGDAMAHVGLQNFPTGGRPVFYKNGVKMA